MRTWIAPLKVWLALLATLAHDVPDTRARHVDVSPVTCARVSSHVSTRHPFSFKYQRRHLQCGAPECCTCPVISGALVREGGGRYPVRVWQGKREGLVAKSTGEGRERPAATAEMQGMRGLMCGCRQMPLHARTPPPFRVSAGTAGTIRDS